MIVPVAFISVSKDLHHRKNKNKIYLQNTKLALAIKEALHVAEHDKYCNSSIDSHVATFLAVPSIYKGLAGHEESYDPCRVLHRSSHDSTCEQSNIQSWRTLSLKKWQPKIRKNKASL